MNSRLAEEHRLVGLDMRGHGLSDKRATAATTRSCGAGLMCLTRERLRPSGSIPLLLRYS
jgi:pimeloyl-ACP methyl ester carboxylesterase